MNRRVSGQTAGRSNRRRTFARADYDVFDSIGTEKVAVEEGYGARGFQTRKLTIYLWV